MKDGKSVARPKPQTEQIKTESVIGDPRDDFRGRLVKHRNRLRSFKAPGDAGPPRKIAHKH
jgi:hypothetical protein